ncbi:MAG: phosphate ABC transporter, permease protein PstA, partial [Candidatus Omnitrophica bacterium]|nr:phosphate ABC transporter, permease protein PstA [Candidatus Omnitrophota bacterium]
MNFAVMAKKNDITQTIGFCILFCCIIITVFFLGSMIFFIIKGGWGAISWEFLTAQPRSAMTKGGVAPA